MSQIGEIQKEIKYNVNNKETIMSQIEEKVKEIIVDKLNCDADQVTPEASFTQDLGADSLDNVELIMELEKAFDTQIPDGDAQNIKTVGDAISYIESKLA